MPRNTQLLLQCTIRLLWNHNSAVVLAAVGVHWLLATEAELKRIVKPMLFLLRSSYDSQHVVMKFIKFTPNSQGFDLSPYFCFLSGKMSIR